MTYAITDIDLSLHRFIVNQHNDKLPIGLLAQLVERCIGVAEVMGSNQVEAWKFSLLREEELNGVMNFYGKRLTFWHFYG